MRWRPGEGNVERYPIVDGKKTAEDEPCYASNRSHGLHVWRTRMGCLVSFVIAYSRRVGCSVLGVFYHNHWRASQIQRVTWLRQRDERFGLLRIERRKERRSSTCGVHFGGFSRRAYVPAKMGSALSVRHCHGPIKCTNEYSGQRAWVVGDLL